MHKNAVNKYGTAYIHVLGASSVHGPGWIKKKYVRSTLNREGDKIPRTENLRAKIDENKDAQIRPGNNPTRSPNTRLDYPELSFSRNNLIISPSLSMNDSKLAETPTILERSTSAHLCAEGRK